MNKLNIAKKGIAAACMALAGTAFAQAVTADKDVNVTVTLTSQCQAQVSAAATLAFGTYVAFRTTALPATPVTVAFECTRGLTGPSVSWAGGDYGTVAGLNYSLSTTAPTKTTTGTAATAVSGGTGSADVWSLDVSGSMPSGQAGASGAAATDLRTLTISF